MGLDARRAAPGQEFGYTDSDGNQKTFKADSAGLVTPKDMETEAILNAFDLPVARVTTTKHISPKRDTATVVETRGPGHPDTVDETKE